MLDGVLHLGLLVEQGVSFVGVGAFTEAGVDGVEPLKVRAKGRDGFLDVAEHGLGFVIVPALFTVQAAVTFSPSLNENVSGIVVPILSGCFGCSSIT